MHLTKNRKIRPFIALKLSHAVNSGKRSKFDERCMINFSTDMVRLKTASVLLSLLLCTVYSSSKAQSKDIAGGISVGINIPAGSFSSTHIVGVSVGYSHRRYVFGR